MVLVALLEYGEHDSQTMLDRMNAGEGVTILAMAEGPLGVLRAMEVRCGPLCIEGRFTLAAAKRVNGAPRLHWWVLDGNPKEHPGWRPNYARDHKRGAAGD